MSSLRNLKQSIIERPRGAAADAAAAVAAGGTSSFRSFKQFVAERPWYAAAYAVLVIAAGVMRLWELGGRAIHHDESLHAYYAWELYSGNGLIHNPMMHGPFQMEATAGLFFLFGDSDYTARLLYAVAGVALVLMPLLFRSRLGSAGALITSMMLTFSPAMLYYSRFARNDILMAVWALGIVIAMWKYFDEDSDKQPNETEEDELSDGERSASSPKMGKTRYLYITAALLAFAFASKESAYMITGAMGLYLVLVLVSRNWGAARSMVSIGEDSPPAAMFKVVRGWFGILSRGLEMRGISKEAGFLVLLVTITLPLWGGFVSIFQDTALLEWTGLTLAGSVGGEGPIGAPLRGGLVVAFLVTALLIFVALVYGLKWGGSVWSKAAVIFYGLFVLMYTTFFTNLVGIGSGVWQSLGYWIVQQGEARGNQPWYYYTVITTVYEFLPLLIAVIGSVYYIRNRDKFGLFLVYWVWITFLLYTAASEKMPWLLVNITLPMIVLSGKFLNDVIGGIAWGRVLRSGGVFAMLGAPIFLVVLWNLAFAGLDGGGTVAGLPVPAGAAALGALAIGLAAGGYLLARRIGPRVFGALALLSVAAVLLVLSARTGVTAAFAHGDVPVEMIVYTQTSPDIHRLASHLREQDLREGGQRAAIDGTSGFHWPWHWYLRGVDGIGYTSYSATGAVAMPNAPVALVHSNNKNAADSTLAESFSEPELIKHRWWFPEAVYRGALDDTGKLFAGLVDRRAWRSIADYFLYRKLRAGGGLCTPANDDFSCLGSENAYIYQNPSDPSPFVPRYQ